MVRLTDHPDITIAVCRGPKATNLSISLLVSKENHAVEHFCRCHSFYPAAIFCMPFWKRRGAYAIPLVHVNVCGCIRSRAGDKKVHLLRLGV